MSNINQSPRQLFCSAIGSCVAEHGLHKTCRWLASTLIGFTQMEGADLKMYENSLGRLDISHFPEKAIVKRH